MFLMYLVAFVSVSYKIRIVGEGGGEGTTLKFLLH